jgi:hypothetical protein
MSSTALTTTDTPRHGKRSRKLVPCQTAQGTVWLSAKFLKAFDVLCSGASPSLAALASGLSERHIYRQLARAGVKALLAERAQEIIQRAGPMAAARLVALAQQDDSKAVAVDATKHILGIQNIRPPPAAAVQINNLSAMFEVDLGPDPEPGRIIEYRPGCFRSADDPTNA